jgi:phosphoribosylformylglycinamidine synthase subunit PurL
VLGRSFRGSGHDIVMLGEPDGNLGGSEYLKTIHGLIAGDAPRIDLAAERALIALLTKASAARLIRSAHDCSDGGVAVTLAECTFDSGGIGCEVDLPRAGQPGDWSTPGTLFGEAGGRVVVSAEPGNTDALLQLARESGVPATVIGQTGGSRLQISVDRSRVIDCAVAEAEQLWSTAFERHFAGRAA